MKRSWLVLLTLAMVCSFGTNCREAIPSLTLDLNAVSARPRLAYGTNIWWSDQDHQIWRERLAELRPLIVRVPILQSAIEPVNDNDDPNTTNPQGFLWDSAIDMPGTGRTITYQKWFQALLEQPDLKVLIYVPYLAPWLSVNEAFADTPYAVAPFPPNDLDEYREFIEAMLRYLVDTLQFPAQRILVEAMNEPDLRCGADPVVPCFWENWSMTDIADVVRVTHEAIQAVDPRIELLGLAECCGTQLVRDLLDHYPEGDYLDGLTYHYYSPQDYDLQPVWDRANPLLSYGRDIYLDEYGSRQYLSEGQAGALWHSWALAELWNKGIAPLQFPISEWPLEGEPYSSMGLFKDWRGDWERKPSYWVYANFFEFVSKGEIVSHTAPSQLDVVTSRQVLADQVRATFWVVNRQDRAMRNLSFAVYGYPESEATLFIYDNLAGSTPISTTKVRGNPLVFEATLPAHSSRCFVLIAKTQPTVSKEMFVPLVSYYLPEMGQ